jgi:hypothetical protein
LSLLIGWVTIVVAIGVVVLRRRDRLAQREGKTAEQVHADFAASEQLRSTLTRTILGALLIIFGVFFAFDDYARHDSGWWFGVAFLAAGWVLIRLMARTSWRRYVELRRFTEMKHDDFLRTEPMSHD